MTHGPRQKALRSAPGTHASSDPLSGAGRANCTLLGAPAALQRPILRGDLGYGLGWGGCRLRDALRLGPAKELTWGVAGTMQPMSRRGIGLLAAVALLASAVNARALEEADAAAFIRSLGERTVNLLRDSSDDREALTRGTAELLDETVAVDVMARLALGRGWQQADEAQRQTYVELCRDYILGTLAYRFASYTGSERFVITGTRPAGGDAIVASRIEYVGYPPLILEWRVRGDGQPRIVDVAVEGVSMVVTTRSEFDAIVARSGIDGLLQELAARSRAAAAKAG